MRKPLVGIVMGSDSDLKVMREAGEVLESFGVAYDITIPSAHRSPKRAESYAKNAGKNGLKVIIAGAGGAAHLAGVLAAHTVLPVIAVPMLSPLNGLDSFYSTLQMPAGIPVATMGIGKGGTRNAAILAVEILAVKYPALQKKLKSYKQQLARKVAKKNRQVKNINKAQRHRGTKLKTQNHRDAKDWLADSGN